MTLRYPSQTAAEAALARAELARDEALAALRQSKAAGRREDRRQAAELREALLLSELRWYARASAMQLELDFGARAKKALDENDRLRREP